MVEYKKLSILLKECQELDSPPFLAIRHLINDDYKRFFLEMNILIPELEFNEQNGVFYFSRGMIKDILNCEWDREPTQREENIVIYGITAINQMICEIDSQTFSTIRFVEDHEWKRMGYV